MLSDYSRAGVYDLVSGRRVRDLPELTGGTGILAAAGTLIATCDDDVLRVLDVATGRRRRTLTMPGCFGLAPDANGTFALLSTNPKPADANAFVVAADLRSGRLFRFAAPPVEITGTFKPPSTTAVYQGAGGLPVVLLGGGSQVYRLPLGGPVTMSKSDDRYVLGQARMASPDGAYRVTIEQAGRITLTETATNRELVSVPAEPSPRSGSFQGVWFSFTSDGRRLLTVHDDELVVYAVPSLTVEHRLPLPVPGDLGPPPSADGISDEWAGSVETVGVDRAVVLYAGVLTRWDLTSGARLDAPVALREGAAGSRRRAAELAFLASHRVSHPDQVAVALPDGGVQVWSTAQGKAVADFPKADAAQMNGSILFNTTGGRLAVLAKGGVTSMWEVARPDGDPWQIPTGLVDGLVGFTPNDQLITVKSGVDNGIEIWNGLSGKKIAYLNTPTSTVLTLRSGVLTMASPGLNRTLRLDPAAWFRTLCGLADRPYTASELVLLNDRRAPVERPCA